MSLAFDLTIHDEEQASAAAAEIMRTILRRNEADGGRAETGGQSPEVAIHGLAQTPEAAAVILASEVLAQGAARMPWLDVSQIKGLAG